MIIVNDREVKRGRDRLLSYWLMLMNVVLKHLGKWVKCSYSEKHQVRVKFQKDGRR